MDLNTILFGSIALLSLLIFFYLGKLRASKSQRERSDRINWSQRFSYRGCLIIALGIFLFFYLLYSVIK